MNMKKHSGCVFASGKNGSTPSCYYRSYSIIINVRLSGVGRNTFSQPLIKMETCKFPLYMSIYCVYILSICLSVRLQKA